MEATTAGPLVTAIEQLGNGLPVVVTGAGISLASGIPTFRGTDRDAIWHRDVTELGTRRYFESDPVGSWRWYLDRFDQVLDKRPNPAHEALAQLERWHVGRGGRFLLVTQNVDTLHEQSGSRQLVKVHGSADRVRCTREGCVNGAPNGSIHRSEVNLAAFAADPGPERLPRCPGCGAVLRQHVLWFDEFYDGHRDYQWGRVTTAAITASIMLFVGTSFAVGVTDLFVRAALQTGASMFAIDPGQHSAPYPGIEMIREPAETVLPRICAALAV